MLFPVRRGHEQDEHMFGHPSLLASNDRSDPERETFLAQQRIAAIARAIGPNGGIVGKMDDVFLPRIRFAWPRDVLLARLQRRSDRMKAGDELPVLAQLITHSSR